MSIKQRVLPILLLAMLVPGVVQAQPWAGILATSRATDWSTKGAGILPARATICQTLTSSATAATINTAITNCPAGQTVFLSAGTYALSAGIMLSKDNVTLRGAGANQTLLNFTGGVGCNGLGSVVCIIASDTGWNQDGPGTTATWTAGYTQGTTVVTLSSTANLAVGKLLVLDQLDDASDDGSVYVCQTLGTCTSQGTDVGRAGRSQHQLVRVTAINGSNVTIDPPVHMPNFRSDRTPGAWWSSSAQPRVGVGIEEMSLNFTGVGTSRTYGIQIQQGYGNWIKGIRSIKANNAHVNEYLSSHTTIRDSYFYDSQNACSQSYGFEPWMAADGLWENNIFEHISSPMVLSGGTGFVAAYNYGFDDYFNCGDPTWFQAAMYNHESSSNYTLWEGNNVPGATADNIHGPSQFNTYFRNRIDGKDPLNTNAKSTQTIAINLYALNRYFNVLGNVLGTSGFHTTYEVFTTTTGAQSGSNCDVTVYRLGWNGHCSNNEGVGDPTLRTTMMRWGNWDVVTSTNDNGTNDSTGTRFVSSEVPSGLTAYPNSVPGSQVLPASFYLSSQPSWWTVGVPYPPIGPDVANGNMPNTGGHANKIPAQVCYDTLSNDGANPYKAFNASTCYTVSGAVAPTILKVIR